MASKVDSAIDNLQDGSSGMVIQRLQIVLFALFFVAGLVIFTDNSIIQILGFDLASNLVSGSSYSASNAYGLVVTSYGGILATNFPRVSNLDQRKQGVVIASFLFTVLLPFIPILHGFVMGSAATSWLAFSFETAGFGLAYGKPGGSA